MPIMEAEMAAAIKEGTSQTNYLLEAFTSDEFQVGVEQNYNGIDLQYSDKGVSLNGVHGSYLSLTQSLVD